MGKLSRDDPENWERVDPGEYSSSNASDSESNDNISDSDDAREHYIDVGKSRLRAQNFEFNDAEGKYSGRNISRKDYDNDEEDDYEDIENYENDNEGSEEDSGSEQSESESDSSQSDSDSQQVGKSKLQQQIEELKREEKSLIRNLNSSAKEDVEKGVQVRNQLALYDGLLDCRIKSQRCLNTANALPSGSAMKLFLLNGGVEVKQAQRSAIQEIKECIGDLLSLQTEMLSGAKEMLKESGVSDVEGSLKVKKRRATTSSEELWQSIQSIDSQIFTPFCADTIDKWNRKVVVSSGGSAILEKKLKIMNQSISSQISSLLSTDRDRLMKRTRVYRGQSKRLGRFLQDDANEDEIFDDGDYYASVLRELIDSKIADSTDSHQLGMQWAKIREMQQRDKKHRENVDRRASKGRKLRYHVHEKLANFMAPVQQGGWHDEMVDELFQSLPRIYVK